MSGRRSAHIAAGLLVALTSSAALAACGGSNSGELERAKAEGRRQALAEQHAKEVASETRKLQREVDKLNRKAATTGGGGTGGAVAPSQLSGSTSCGDGLSVNSVTSCPFAENVKATYESSGGASSIDVYSPVTGRSYTMACSGGVPVVCIGGNNATVYIR